MRLSSAQLKVLRRLERGELLREFLTPGQPFFRTLGKNVPAVLRHTFRVGSPGIAYRTFWVLFKHNLIKPLADKGPISPVSYHTITARGRQHLRGNKT